MALPFESLAEARSRVQAAGGDACVVVDDVGTVLGLLAGDALRANARSPVVTLADPSPRTVRASADLDDVREALEGDVPLLVTTPEGRLLGAIRPGDLESR